MGGPTGELYRLDGADGKLAYNPSRPFQCVAPTTGQEVTAMYVRVESVEADWFNRLERPPGVYDPEAILYLESEPGHWVPATPHNFGPTGLQHPLIEDPFLEPVGDELVFGGVRIDFATSEARTELYRGPEPGALRPFATIHTTDIRLVQLRDERILVMTRSQPDEAGTASFGAVTVDVLEKLEEAVLEDAKPIDGLQEPELEFGVDELYFLPKGDGRDRDEIGVLAHTAKRYEGGRVFCVATALRILNPYTYAREGIKHTPAEPIARRSDWPEGKVKKPETADVVMPSAVARRDDHVVLIAGLSDGEIGELEIPDPFAPEGAGG